MSFCLRPNVCKKCGKPLTLFEGWTCLECDKAEQEPNTDVLDKIRAEIRKKMRFDSFNEGIVSFDDISKIFDKYKTESEE